MCDMDDLSVDVEKAQASAHAMDKKQRQFDRLIGQWKEKCEGAARELTVSQTEARAFSAEVFKLKAELQEQVGHHCEMILIDTESRFHFYQKPSLMLSLF